MAEDVKEKPTRQSDRFKNPVQKSPLETSIFGSSPDQNQINGSIAATKDRARKIPKTNGVIDFGPAVIYNGRKDPNASAGGSEKRRERCLNPNLGPKLTKSAPQCNLANGIFRDSSSQDVDVARSRSLRGLRTPTLGQREDPICQIIEPPIVIGSPPRVVPSRNDYNTTPWYGKIPVSLWSLNKATPIKQARITNYQKPSYKSGSEDNAEEVLQSPENPQAALPFNSDRLMTPNPPEDRKTGGIPNPTSVPNFRRQDSDEVMVIESVTNSGKNQEVAEIAPIKPMHVDEPKLDLIDISTPSPERLSAPGRLIDRSTGATGLKSSDFGTNATSKTPAVRFWILQSRQRRMVWELWPSANLVEVDLASIFEAVRMYANDCTSNCLKVRLQTVQQSFTFRISRDEVEHFEDMKTFMLEAIEGENQNEENHDVRPNIWISPPERDQMRSRG